MRKLTAAERLAKRKSHQAFLVGTRLAPKGTASTENLPLYDDIRYNWNPNRTPRELLKRDPREL